jgi:hypothetical protein
MLEDAPPATPAYQPIIDIRKIRTPPVKDGRGIIDSRFLEDPMDEDPLVQSLMNGVTSKVLQKKKKVIVIDNNLGGSKRGRILEMFRAVEKRAEKDDFFGRLWKGHLEVRTSLAAISEFEGDPDAELFVFALDNADRRSRLAPSADRHIAFINENGIQDGAYYPLFEIVMITLADSLDPEALKSVEPVLGRMNIEKISADRAGSVLTFILLPKTSRIDTDRELPDRYARLAALLMSA